MPLIETLSYLPQRIVSLVPSQTELLVDLGLTDRLVGVTKFCVHPAGLRASKTIVGGTKKFRFEVIDALQPDLILANKEENYKEGIEQLAETYPVWMSDIFTLSDALTMIRTVGQLTGTSEKATSMATKVDQKFQSLKLDKPVRVAYLIWQNPMMVAGNQTFIHDMLTRCGWINVFGDQRRYPEITPAQLQQVQPEAILLSSEPFPFQEKHLAAFQQLCPSSRVRLVDGEMFSWYGSRLLQAPAYFTTLSEP